MRIIYSIFKRDFFSLLLSPMFFFLGTMYTAFLSYRYLRTLFQFIQMKQMPGANSISQNIHLSVFVTHMNFFYLVMLILIPIFSMKLISEERKEGSLDLLLTAPITTTQIVLGKFLAGWGIMSVFLLLALIYPVLTGFVAKFDWGLLWSSYIGMFLTLGLYVSFGLFASSLTKSLILSAFISFLLIIIIMMSGGAVASIGNPVLSDIAQQMALMMHLQDFFDGQLSLSGFVYMISMMVFGCFLTQKAIEVMRLKS